MFGLAHRIAKLGLLVFIAEVLSVLSRKWVHQASAKISGFFLFYLFVLLCVFSFFKRFLSTEDVLSTAVADFWGSIAPPVHGLPTLKDVAPLQRRKSWVSAKVAKNVLYYIADQQRLRVKYSVQLFLLPSAFHLGNSLIDRWMVFPKHVERFWSFWFLIKGKFCRLRV